MESKLTILYEDNHLIIVNKSNSDLVQGDKTGDVSLLDKVKEYIKVKYEKPGEVYLGLAHRLDRPVSGVTIFAKTSKALTRLNEMFRDKEIEKTYWAIVKQRPPLEEDRLVHYLTHNEEKNKSMVSDKEKKNSKLSSLRYKVLAVTKYYTLLEIVLETGRHHQIRAQLAKIGCPIKGDMKYGFERSNKCGGIDLHARKVAFIHPVKKEPVVVIAPVPKDNLWKDFLTMVS
jgi:23S rRNA pseudouridine1911/1915/1917 synthase